MVVYGGGELDSLFLRIATVTGERFNRIFYGHWLISICINFDCMGCIDWLCFQVETTLPNPLSVRLTYYCYIQVPSGINGLCICVTFAWRITVLVENHELWSSLTSHAQMSALSLVNVIGFMCLFCLFEFNLSLDDQIVASAYYEACSLVCKRFAPATRTARLPLCFSIDLIRTLPIVRWECVVAAIANGHHGRPIYSVWLMNPIGHWIRLHSVWFVSMDRFGCQSPSLLSVASLIDYCCTNEGSIMRLIWLLLLFVSAGRSKIGPMLALVMPFSSKLIIAVAITCLTAVGHFAGSLRCGIDAIMFAQKCRRLAITDWADWHISEMTNCGWFSRFLLVTLHSLLVVWYFNY